MIDSFENKSLDFNRCYFSNSVGQLPVSNDAQADTTIGAYITDEGSIQKVKWTGSEWKRFGNLIEYDCIDTEISIIVRNENDFFKKWILFGDKKFGVEGKLVFIFIGVVEFTMQINLNHPNGEKLFFKGNGIKSEDTILTFDATRFKYANVYVEDFRNRYTNQLLAPFISISNGNSFGGISNLKIENKNQIENTIGIALYNGASLLKFSGWIENKSKGASHGITMIGGCYMNASDSNLSGCGNRYLLDNQGKDLGKWLGSGIYNNCSTLYAVKIKANNCGDYGVDNVNSASCYVRYLEARNCGHHGAGANSSSKVTIIDSDLSNSIDDCLVAHSGSTVDARGTLCNGAIVNYGLVATRGSIIIFDGGSANYNGSDGILANYGSKVICVNTKVENNKGNGIIAQHGSIIAANNATVSNNGKNGIYSRYESRVCFYKGIAINNRKKDFFTKYSSKITIDSNPFLIKRGFAKIYYFMKHVMLRLKNTLYDK